jgi:hypothetical protein
MQSKLLLAASVDPLGLVDLQPEAGQMLSRVATCRRLQLEDFKQILCTVPVARISQNSHTCISE